VAMPPSRLILPPLPRPAIPPQHRILFRADVVVVVHAVQRCFFLLEEMGVDLVVHVIVDVVVVVFAAHADKDVAERCSRGGGGD